MAYDVSKLIRSKGYQIGDPENDTTVLVKPFTLLIYDSEADVPIANELVLITNPDNPEFRVVKMTDKNGTIRGLPKGDYKVVVLGLNYSPADVQSTH